jgi:hypothetical protein
MDGWESIPGDPGWSFLARGDMRAEVLEGREGWYWVVWVGRWGDRAGSGRCETERQAKAAAVAALGGADPADVGHPLGISS